MNAFLDAVVVGDVMLDIYTDVYGKGQSPESNCPLVEVNATHYALGGAGNVAANLAALGKKVALIGLIGDDAESRTVEALCVKRGIDARLLKMRYGVPTTVKHRFASKGKHLLRVDREPEVPLDTDVLGEFNGLVSYQTARLLAAILRNASERGNTPPIVVISDYDKGLLTAKVVNEIVTPARYYSCPLLVDPPHSGSDAWERFDGRLTLLKPNQIDAMRFLGDDADNMPSRMLIQSENNSIEDYLDLCSRVRAKLRRKDIHVAYLWITLGMHGSVVCSADPERAPEYLPANKIEIADVTGAGDTALAIMVGHIAEHGYAFVNVVEGVRRANLGAAVAVSHRGTYAVTADDLARAIAPSAQEKKDGQATAESDPG